jgi:UDP-2,3-diacylglucosamine pyrophosphatase LpxH
MEKAYKTIVISDLHLGNPYSNWKLLKKFLEENSCDNLFLNGDIIDNHYLLQNKKWLNTEEHDFFLTLINKGIYIVGNHEVFDIKEPTLWKSVALLHSYYIYESNSKKYFISHGHNTIFKNPITESSKVLRLIDWSIRSLAKIQKIHKGIFFQKGKINIDKGVEFEILSEDSRKFFKTGLKIISRYKNKIKKYKSEFNVDAVICGHIHHPEIKKNYLNSGDWVENYSALIEDFNGNWKLKKLK